MPKIKSKKQIEDEARFTKREKEFYNAPLGVLEPIQEQDESKLNLEIVPATFWNRPKSVLTNEECLRHGIIRRYCLKCRRRHRINECPLNKKAKANKGVAHFKKICKRCGALFPRQTRYQKVCHKCTIKSNKQRIKTCNAFWKDVRAKKRPHPYVPAQVIDLSVEELRL